MHWTLQSLLALSALCLIGNAVQSAMTGSVRMSGILICSAWAAQQAFWALTGTDSLTLFLLCDAALLAWFYRHSRGVLEQAAGWLILPTMGLALFQHLAGGHTLFSWWLNYWLVAMQMALCLPRPKFQRSLNTFSHGSVKSLGKALA